MKSYETLIEEIENTGDAAEAAIKDRMIAEIPDLEYVEVPDVGHAPMLMDETVTQAIERFIAS